ncbi:MAG: beta-galactosidase [Verrucomicrobiae bacterium]|nr:beta-galactosidase [Verrucomicrobiae bacterium]NNJ44309.1 beta-galactosidase [Akkermansiaceae bacterium]
MTLALACLVIPAMADKDTISLAGTWGFQLDGEDVGFDQQWYTKKLQDTVKLPGTTDENHKGVLKNEECVDRLSRVWYWKGPAWYQREVTIPESWKGKKITLLLERTKNTRVWVDQTFCGWHDSLSAAQIFDVTQAMTPGKHTITVVVDNAKLPPVGPSHAVDERTQTNWNGIIGRLELTATDPVWLKDVQVYPNAAKKEARVRVTIGNITGQPASGNITIGCKSYNVEKPASFNTQVVKVNEKDVMEFTYKPGDNVPLWDEFEPAMLRLDVKLETQSGNSSFADKKSVSFGMRDFKKDRNLIKINGKTAFLRGRLDCANYPLTGYPPMDKAEWLRIFKITLDWGINHYRFHSWCPPEEAFQAADELGIYLQPEIPSKRSGYKTLENTEAAHWNVDRLDVASTETKVTLYDYAKREGEQIFEQFGNHPSFVMFTLGNELGRNQGMFEMVDYFKKIDPRRLYAQGANNVHWNPSLAVGDEFWITGKVEKKSKPLRGSFSLFDFPNPPIESLSPSTLFDFSESIQGIQVPMIGHETGQFQVYPDYRDIPKFTGVVKAKNYEIFRDRLKEAGMHDQAHDFVMASGALAAICYREDIEMALRTPGFAGIQLLDIQDFPGQGTALVGMLNDFMESKGVIEPETWRQFCSETVPLLRMKKYTWTSDETFLARAQVAHYGPADIEDAQVTWTVTGSQGKKIAGGAFDKVTILQGKVFDIDMFALPLDKVTTPQKLTISLAIVGTKYRNDYSIWVYPPMVDTKAPAGVMVTDSFQAKKTKAHLAKGGSVLLLPKHDNLPHSIQGGFQCDFWSPMFSMSAKKRKVAYPAPGTLGFLCDPKSPAFAGFPTEFHTNWQWWHLLKNSRPIKFDGTPDDYRPIVQMIDNFVRNSKLGLIAETKVGKGKMLICAVDLLSHQDKPEARQLLHSLLQYTGSKNFAPKAEIKGELLSQLLPQ